MSRLADRLFFTPPFIPIHEAAHVLRLCEHVPDFQRLLWVLESQQAMFSNYSMLLSLLKDHYGFIEEENPFKKARIAIQAYQEEKKHQGPRQEEKAILAFAQKIFQARTVYRRAAQSQDPERDARAGWEASFLWYQKQKRENKAAVAQIAAEIREERLKRIESDSKRGKDTE